MEGKLTSAAARPASGSSTPLDRIEAGLPRWLLDAPVWLLHRQKQPFYAADGTPRRGKLDTPEDRARLATYWKARAALLLRDFDGVGVALGPIPGADISLCGIDLDECFAEGKLQDHAQQILSEANSYAERSPSGSGLHIIGLGEIGTTKKAGLEIYSSRRYFTVTGDALNSADLADISGAASLARRLYGSEALATTAPTPSTGLGVVEGERNDFLIREAGKLQRIGLDPSALHAAVHSLNQSRCQPPLPDEEVDAISHGILRYPPSPSAKLLVAAGSFAPVPDHEFVNRPNRRRSSGASARPLDQPREHGGIAI